MGNDPYRYSKLGIPELDTLYEGVVRPNTWALAEAIARRIEVLPVESYESTDNVERGPIAEHLDDKGFIRNARTYILEDSSRDEIKVRIVRRKHPNDVVSSGVVTHLSFDRLPWGKTRLSESLELYTTSGVLEYYTRCRKIMSLFPVSFFTSYLPVFSKYRRVPETSRDYPVRKELVGRLESLLLEFESLYPVFCPWSPKEIAEQ